MGVINKVLGPKPECGGCRACCTSVAVSEIGKPAHSPCRWECPSGCEIYNHHPPSCKSYECFWRGGGLDSRLDYRPDNLGVIFQGGELPGIGDYVCAVENVPGTIDSQKVRFIIGKIVNLGLGVVSTDSRGFVVACDGPAQFRHDVSKLMARSRGGVIHG